MACFMHPRKFKLFYVSDFAKIFKSRQNLYISSIIL